MSDSDLIQSKDTLPKRRTFSISFNGAFNECIRIPHLLKMISAGQYVFVDSHFCLNHSKYILWDEDAKPRLTWYARTHIRECCLAFDLTQAQILKDKAQRFKNILTTKRKGYIDLSAVLHFEPHYSDGGDNEVCDRSELIKKYNSNTLTIMKTLPMNFSGALDVLIKQMKMTEDELAEASNLSERTIRRLRNTDPQNVSIETVIQLCIGMKLPPPLSNCLLKASGNNFMMTELHMMYQFLLGACYHQSIDECNCYLIKQGFSPLGRQN